MVRNVARHQFTDEAGSIGLVAMKLPMQMRRVNGHQPDAVGRGGQPTLWPAHGLAHGCNFETARRVLRAGDDGQLGTLGTGSDRQQPPQTLPRDRARGDVLEHEGRRQLQLRERIQRMALEQQQRCRFNSVAEHAMMVAAGVRSTENCHGTLCVAMGPRRIELYRPGIGHHGRLAAGRLGPAVGAVLQAHQMVLPWRTLRHCDDRQREHEQAGVRRQPRLRILRHASGFQQP